MSDHTQTERNSHAISLLQAHARIVEQHLRGTLSNNPEIPRQLIEAMSYSLMAGGKRIRPALVFESYLSCLPSTLHSPPSPSALAAATAMELIHTFSLVHDDLPAMDDDDLRRGKPTNHKVYGEAMAILAGDAMITLAFELLAREADPKIAPQLIGELARAAGAGGMIGGQVLDMAGEKQALAMEQLQQIHRMKTGAMLTASCRLGAISAGANQAALERITNFGNHIGLAFQIVDDILDVTSTTEQLGKATNKDHQRGKNTYPALLGLDASRAEARRWLGAGLGELKTFGSSADGLRSLANFVVDRAA